MLEETFEGFRVVWFPEQTLAIDPVIGSSIDGKWTATESSDDYEFDLRLTESGVVVLGFCRATKNELVISNPTVNQEYVLFTAYHPTLRKTTNHVFRLVDADRCEDRVTKCEYYLRADSSQTATGRITEQ
jgi:hypothetical protein